MIWIWMNYYPKAAVYGFVVRVLPGHDYNHNQYRAVAAAAAAPSLMHRQRITLTQTKHFMSNVNVQIRNISNPNNHTMDPLNNNDNNNNNLDDDRDDNNGLDGAWSQWQDWALIDHLSDYLITTVATETGRQTQAARWRAMVQEVPEFNGFPVEYVRDRYQRLLLSSSLVEGEDASDYDKKSKKKLPTKILPKMLPLLEQYAFVRASSDQLTGYGYGITNIADGTLMTTPTLKGTEVTIPLGYVQSDDGVSVYELGTPKYSSSFADDEDFYSLDIANSISKSSISILPDKADGMLVNLGLLTGFLLASATAVNTISHHVSVHVYWV